MKSPFRNERRQGITISVFTLTLMPVFLGFGFLMLNAAYYAETRQTLQNTADSCSLAAVQSLVDERWLRKDFAIRQNILAESRLEALRYADLNPSLLESLQLPPNTTDNPTDGDVVMAYLPSPRDKHFYAVDLTDPNAVNLANTVRVTTRRTSARKNAVPVLGSPFFVGIATIDLMTHSTATLDRYVVGFHPVNSAQPIPMMPIALFSDPYLEAAQTSWEFQTLPPINDQLAFVPGQQPPFVAGQDGLPEITFVMEASDQATARMLLLGLSALDLQNGQKMQELSRQVSTGILQGDLLDLGGSFVMTQTGAQPYELLVGSNHGNTNLYPNLQNWLQSQQGQQRIWPLYSSLDSNVGTATITGFVAARIVQATYDGVSGQLTLTLQPTMMSTRTAVTIAQPTTSVYGGVSILNPYVCKIRLVE